MPVEQSLRPLTCECNTAEPDNRIATVVLMQIRASVLTALMLCLTNARTRIKQKCISIRSWLWFCGERTVGNDLGDMESLEGKMSKRCFQQFQSPEATQALNACWLPSSKVFGIQPSLIQLLSFPSQSLSLVCTIYCFSIFLLQRYYWGHPHFSSSRSSLASSAEQQRVMCAGSC